VNWAVICTRSLSGHDPLVVAVGGRPQERVEDNAEVAAGDVVVVSRQQIVVVLDAQKMHST